MSNRRIQPGTALIIAYAMVMLGCGIAYGQPPVADMVQTSQVRDARIAAPPDDMFVDVQIEKHQIYLGETIRVEYDVYVASSRGEVYYDVEEPDFTRWYSVEGAAPKPSPALFHQKNYVREPFAVYFVTPIMPGKIALPALKVKVPFLHPESWISQSAKYIEVLPLPEPVPAGFGIGNVGKLSLEVEPYQDRVRVGDVVVIIVNVTGNVPVTGIELAPYRLTRSSAAFKAYPVLDSIVSESVVGDQLVSKRSFRYRLLALKEGEWTLDPFRLVTFDTKSHHYRTLMSEPFKVTVEPSKKLEHFEASKPQLLAIDKEGIRPIEVRGAEGFSFSMYWMFVPVGFFVFVVLWEILYARSKHWTGRRARLSRMRELLGRLPETRRADEQLRGLEELLEIRYGMPRSAGDAEMKALLGREMAPEDADLIVDVMRRLRMCSYDSQAGSGDERMAAVVGLVRGKAGRGGG